MSPREIVAKKKCPCKKCPTWIKPGDKIRWAKGTGAEHVVCPPAGKVRQAPGLTTPPNNLPPAGIVRQTFTPTELEMWTKFFNAILAGQGSSILGFQPEEVIPRCSKAADVALQEWLKKKAITK